MGWTSIWLLIALACFILFSVAIIIKRSRKGYWRLGLKEVYEGAVYIGCLLWAVYALIFSIATLPWLAGVVDNLIEASDLPDAQWVFGLVLVFYFITAWCIAIWVVVKGATFKAQYTGAEQELKDMEREKQRKWMRDHKLGWLISKKER